MADALLSVRLRHCFSAGGSAADLDIHFELTRDWSVLFGPSGAGKSTVLRAIAGLLRPRSGRIVFAGATLTDTASGVFVPPHQRRAGYVGQKSALFPHLSIFENVRFGVRADADGNERAQAMLEMFQGGHLSARRPQDVSGGERQRVLLARALAPRPRLLLMDEPFAGLDYQLRSALLDDLKHYLKENPTPVLSVTHDVSEVFALEAEVIVLNAGRVTAQGDAHTVLARHRGQLLELLRRSAETA